MTVVPGDLDEQSPGVAVAGLGDVAAMLLIAGGVLAWCDAQPRRQLAWVAEAGEISDLGDQPERCQRRDTAKPGEDLDLSLPALGCRYPLELTVERVDLTFDAVEVGEHLLQRQLRERVIQALSVDPTAVLEREGRLAVAERSDHGAAAP